MLSKRMGGIVRCATRARDSEETDLGIKGGAVESRAVTALVVVICLLYI